MSLCFLEAKILHFPRDNSAYFQLCLQNVTLLVIGFNLERNLQR